MSPVRAFFAGALFVGAVIACNSCLGDDPVPLLGADAAPPPTSTSTSTPPDSSTAPTPAEACEKALPASRDCYTGDAGTRGKGACKDGHLECLSTGESHCVAEVKPTSELCNELDDDCNGVVDDGFDKLTSPTNCGTCNKACGSDETCNDGGCEKRTETSCNDGVDNDSDGDTDCKDSECFQQSCGANCTCGADGKGHETDCNNHADDDGDGALDCADSDCPTCGTGCTCKAGVNAETACNDGADNDKDGLVDCKDPDCAAASCGTGCVCASNAKKETNCADGVDNDGDTKKDCADSDCNGQTCTKAGGGAGSCASGTCK
jgi:hypothetical protein